MKNLVPGYYWVREFGQDQPVIVKLTKNSGWRHFDGSHVKMVPNKPMEILQRIEYVEEKVDP